MNVKPVLRPSGVWTASPMLPGTLVEGLAVKSKLPLLTGISLNVRRPSSSVLKTKSRSTPTSSRKLRWTVRKRASTVTWMARVSRSCSSRLTSCRWFSGSG
jgi:hypothetical protein